MASCFYHEDREAAARCAVCGKGICEECAVDGDGMFFCSAECKSKGESMNGRSGDVLAEKRKTNASSAVRRLIYIFAVILAVAAAYYFCTRNREAIDNKMDSSIKQIPKSSAKFIKDTKKAIPTSSQIRREKENLVK